MLVISRLEWNGDQKISLSISVSLNFNISIVKINKIFAPRAPGRMNFHNDYITLIRFSSFSALLSSVKVIGFTR